VHYDLVLYGGHVVDPINKVDGIRDVAIANGKIERVKEAILAGQASTVVDVTGKTVIPGIIDSHAHFTRPGNEIGHRMMARVGVTTAIDFGTTPENLATSVRTHGAGLNSGCLYSLIPGQTISSANPKRSKLKSVVEMAIEQGALGIKLIGMHRPITPEAASYAIEITNEMKVYVASHLGTTESASNLTGLREVPELIGDNHLHIAHVNSYCRGMIKPPVEEALEASDIVSKLRDRVVSESYLGTINGTGGECHDGVPANHVTRNCLILGGYEPTQQGLAKAILNDYCSVLIEYEDECVLVSGEEGIKAWEQARTNVEVSFPVNPASVTSLLATAKDKTGEFIIDAISTDGGAYPRNLIVERGLALVRYGAITLREFVIKCSTNPARMFGLQSKGHLSEGADADITILDNIKGEAYMSLANGTIIMVDGVLTGSGGTILTTGRGKHSFEELNLPVKEAKVSDSLLYNRGADENGRN